MSGQTARDLNDTLGLATIGAAGMKRWELDAHERLSPVLKLLKERRVLEDLLDPPARRLLRLIEEAGGVTQLMGVPRDRLSLDDPFSTAATLARLVRDLPEGSLAEAGRLAGDRYCTLDALVHTRGSLADAVAQAATGTSELHGLQMLVSNLKLLRTPWIDVDDPQRSLTAVGLLGDLGRTLGGTDLFTSAGRTNLYGSLGYWEAADPVSYARLSTLERAEILLDYGFDERLVDIPEPAYTDALWVTGIGARSYAERGVVIRVRMPRTMASQAYTAIRYLERCLRQLIDKAMRAHYGEGWEKKALDPQTRERWARSHEKNDARPGEPLILYSELGDLQHLLLQRNHWKMLFKPVCHMSPEELRVATSRLIAIRHPASHARDIGPHELVTALTEARHVLRAFGYRVPWGLEVVVG